MIYGIFLNYGILESLGCKVRCLARGSPAFSVSTPFSVARSDRSKGSL